jgi:hypothetical protein
MAHTLMYATRTGLGNSPSGSSSEAGNRVTTGRALIVARHTADLVPFQFDLEVFTEGSTGLFPRRLEVNRLRLRHYPLHGGVNWEK